MRSGGATKELEAEFGVGTKEGTLVLTNKRLIFVCTNEKEEDLPGSPLNPLSKFRLVYSEVEDLASIPASSPNVFVPIASVSLVAGHRGGIERPSLKLTWNDNNGDHTVVFTEGLTGRRKRNLNDWAPIITNLKVGTQKLAPLPSPPSTDSLEGQIVRILSDMQEKGVFEIEEAVETEFKVDLGPRPGTSRLRQARISAAPSQVSRFQWGCFLQEGVTIGRGQPFQLRLNSSRDN